MLSSYHPNVQYTADSELDVILSVYVNLQDDIGFHKPTSQAV